MKILTNLVLTILVFVVFGFTGRGQERPPKLQKKIEKELKKQHIEGAFEFKPFDGVVPGSFVLGSNVDAISGATISANSIVDDLNSFDALVEELLNISK